MRGRRWPDLVFAGDAPRETLSRAATAGRLRRLARGIYTPAHEAPEQVVRRNWWRILAHEFPGAIIGDRSARAPHPDEGGRLTVIHSRRRPIELPGLTIIPRRGPGPLTGDQATPDGLWISSQARGLLDNAAGAGARYLSGEELEHWVSDLLTRHGEFRLNALRDQARDLAQQTGRLAAFERLDRIVAAALVTGPADAVASDALRARAAGMPYDRDRLDRFTALAAFLGDLAPEPLPALAADEPRRRLLPFYEAYFSNYIEGTEFTLDEAAAIVFEHEVPSSRPQDAHDVVGTYQLVSDEAEMGRTPATGDELIDLLLARHAIVMAGRPDMAPGQFKDRANRAGSTIFVAPELVRGTLRAGFDGGASLVDPFARAAFLMFLVSEVHPFTDGNGRIARVMMNAELVRAGEVRIIVPTVYRLNYLAALRGATHNGRFEALAAVLRFAQKYTARVDFSSRAVAELALARTNALRDPNEAEDYGIRLTLP